MLTDMIFTRRGRDLCTMKFLMYGPSFGWSISHLYSEGELFRNRKDVSRRNGVVGNTGRKMPRMPNPNDINPNAASRYFISSIFSKHEDSKKINKGFCSPAEALVEL